MAFGTPGRLLFAGCMFFDLAGDLRGTRDECCVLVWDEVDGARDCPSAILVVLGIWRWVA